MRIFLVMIVLIFAIGLAGCEETDLRLAAEAGVDAYKAVVLSDETVVALSRQTAAYMDSQHILAPADSPYVRRLQALVADLHQRDGYTFNYRVYLQDEVNAFAMADGTIRIYSGLMDLLDDGELRFVIGHEMGHVVKEHSRNKLRLAYGASALRKGIAAQQGVAGEIARSQLGGLVELLTGAQFSQFEEMVADDYGLSFLQTKGDNPEDAVAALEKLAGLGSGHSFLSSHPDPADRAERIRLQIQGKAPSIAETRQGLIDWIKAKLQTLFPSIFGRPEQKPDAG